MALCVVTSFQKMTKETDKIRLRILWDKNQLFPYFTDSVCINMKKDKLHELQNIYVWKNIFKIFKNGAAK